MPYEWTDHGTAPERSGAAVVSGAVSGDISGAAVLRLWPHRSLPREGFAGFIAAETARYAEIIRTAGIRP